MMKYLCNHPDLRPLLAEWAGDRELLLANFVFWELGGSSEEKTIVGLIRSLLYEVLCEDPSLIRTLFPETRTKVMQHPERRDGPEPITSEIGDAMEKLVELLAMLSPPSSTKLVRCCFFVDGLDEFGDPGGEVRGSCCHASAIEERFKRQYQDLRLKSHSGALHRKISCRAENHAQSTYQRGY